MGPTLSGPVAFQGERGAYSEDAVVAFFGEVPLLPCDVLGRVFAAVAEGRAAYMVVPVENSQAGSINETYDLLLAHALHIYGEIHQPVNHCLLALPGTKLSDVRRVLSHPQALAQSDAFLRDLGAEIVPNYDTAGSAKQIAEQRLEGAAAVASRRAGQIYGLDVLAEYIQTNANNFTRFFVVGKEPPPADVPGLAGPPRPPKTSVVFSVTNEPGTLYAALRALAERHINLTKIESRPSKSTPWEYVFYVDFDGSADEPRCREALADMRAATQFLRILGTYPRAKS